MTTCGRRRHFPASAIARLALSTTCWTVFASTAAKVSACSSSANQRHKPMLLPTQLHPYVPPAWCQGRLLNAPRHRLALANLPTPLYQLVFPSASNLSNIFGSPRQQQPEPATRPQRQQQQDSGCLGLRLLIKRDDATGGVELGGNKLRKLEFLLADAVRGGCDSVVTIGGLQSNHCRATAAAARMVGMEPHLILRTPAAAASTTARSTPAGAVPGAGAAAASSPVASSARDAGTVGNLLVDRAVGASLYTCTPGEYGRVGSDALVSRLCHRLGASGNRRPYPIPVGGSSGLGSWGYVQAVDELVRQLRQAGEEASVDHVVFASGSGGTAAGIAIGLALAYDGLPSSDGYSKRKRPQVHAVGLCDAPDYFYGQVAKIAAEMGLVVPEGRGLDDYAREHLTVHQGKGLGYAVSAPDELAFVASFARETGVVLDPVYSGKALYQFLRLVRQDPDSFQGQTVLFWHTGGTLGLYDKVDDASFLEQLKAGSPCHRLDVYGKGIGVDVSRDVG